MENQTGEYRLFLQILRAPEQIRGRTIRLSAWVKGENVTIGDAGWKTGSIGVSFQTPDGEWKHLSTATPKGTFDWQKLETTLTIPANARNLTLRAGLNGANGILWLDELTLEQ